MNFHSPNSGGGGPQSTPTRHSRTSSVASAHSIRSTDDEMYHAHDSDNERFVVVVGDSDDERSQTIEMAEV
jgi:hypothetical protein